MTKQRYIYLFLTLFAMLLNYAQADTLSFTNFSNTIVLTKTEGDLWVDSNTAYVRLSGDLILTTTPSITNTHAVRLAPFIQSATTLYEGNKNFYRIEINPDISMQQAIDTLTHTDSVLQVQPDMQQLQDRAAIDRNTPVTANYIDALELPDYWQKTRGDGVQIAIIDDGFNLQHPELLHTQLIFEYDAERLSLTSRPQRIDRHGTRVAGIIFAAHDQTGIDGVAPEAALIAIRQPTTWTSKTLISFQIARLAGADVVNCSWNSRWLLEPVATAISDMAINGRNGLGIAVVFAAGNQGQEIQPDSIEASIDAAIVVGSADSDGSRKAFSNYGDSVDVFAFGNPVLSTASDGRYDSFAGTSLSAAIISGYIALLISENPSITLPQINRRLQSYNRRL